MKKIYTLVAAALLSVSAFAQFKWDTVSYTGAFPVANGKTGIYSNDWTTGWTNWDPQNATYGAVTKTQTGDITANTTWDSNEVVLLNGFVHVTGGAELTIKPGCVVIGRQYNSTSSDCGVLVITAGSKIHAVGRPDKPIVFTSQQAKGSRSWGDWGGIVLLGKAPVNTKTNTVANPDDGKWNIMKIEGFLTDDVKRHFGGIVPNDNSGELAYVRIEFAGVSLNPNVFNQEINSLTLGGVGSGTQIHHIQVSFAGDDAYEFFGGSVDAKYLIGFRTSDDDFDTDMGYNGRIQFGLVIKDPDSEVKDNASNGGDANGFECDNTASSPYNCSVPSNISGNPAPYNDAAYWTSLHTQPTFSNITLIGPYGDGTKYGSPVNPRDPAHNHSAAAHLRRNNAQSILNSLFVGFHTGLRYQDAGTFDNISATADSTCTFKNNYLIGIQTTKFVLDAGNGFDATWYRNYAATNNIDTTKVVADLDFEAPAFNNLDAAIRDYRIGSTSFAATGAVWNDINIKGDKQSPVLPPVEPNDTTGVKEIVGLSSISLYPNPTNNNVNIEFNLNEKTSVVITVVDLTGKSVKTVANSEFTSGNNHISFSANDLNNGVYFVRMESETGSKTLRLVVVK